MPARTRSQHAIGMTRVMVVALSARTGGGGSLVLNQMAALSATGRFHLTIHAADDVARTLQRVAPEATVVVHPRRPIAMRLLYEQIVLAWRAQRFDVLYVPGNLGLLLARVPQVVCQQNAWYFTSAVRAFRRRRCPRAMRARLTIEAAQARASIRRARVVVAVSATMKAMIEEDLGPRRKIRTILSATPRLVPTAVPPAERSYVLAVAPDDPHKDLVGLVAAFERHPDLPPLRVVGRASPARRAQLEALAPGRFAHLGPIDDRGRLADLYAAATCVVAHSFLESFGMTPAEALLCGTPVAAADIPAHREVCGRQAHYYDPRDPAALAAAVRAACAAPRPRPPAEVRSWHDNAAELADVLEAVARDARR